MTAIAVARGRRSDTASVRNAPPAAPASAPPTVRITAPTVTLLPNDRISSSAGLTWMKISPTRSTPYQFVNRSATATDPPAASPATAPDLAALEVVAVTISPATTRGRTATYAARNGTNSRTARAPVTCVPIRLISATFARRPTNAT